MSTNSVPEPLPGHSELIALTLRACHLAKAAVAGAAEALVSFDPANFDTVNDCERELDRIDREMDERAAAVLPGLDTRQARELLACVKFVIDLERIGDLISGFAGRVRAVGRQLAPEDVRDIAAMAALLEKMLTQVYDAFSKRDLNRAIAILRADGEIDRLRNLLFIRHLETSASHVESVQVLLMAQALERAGDHTTNLAEEVCHLVSGHTIRHLLRLHDKPMEQMFLDWLREQDVRRAKTHHGMRVDER